MKDDTKNWCYILELQKIIFFKFYFTLLNSVTELPFLKKTFPNDTGVTIPVK